jgi:hypothetical protein
MDNEIEKQNIEATGCIQLSRKVWMLQTMQRLLWNELVLAGVNH